MSGVIITIDGPSGSGKGTLARTIAEQLGYALLDSGALYRLTALAADRRGLDLNNAEAVAEVARNLDVQFAADGGIHLEGETVGPELRTETTGEKASVVAAHPPVREALLQRQRDFAGTAGLVADGRDMGTVVFPEAPLKVFLDASPEVRAERRYKQLIEKGLSANLPALVEEIRARDERDRNRPVAPLVPAPDAVVIDSSAMDADAVAAQVFALLRERIGPAGNEAR
ncbi:MAG: (d)CMP kinase [Halothiobacillaceae bacterium]